MKFRVDKTINNNEPIYEFYKSGDQNPHRWIWFPQYKAGSRTIETHINKTLCYTAWRKENRPEVGYVKYQNSLFSDRYIEFKSDKPMYEKLGWRVSSWSAEEPICRTPVAFSSSDTPSDYFKFMFVRNPWDRVVSCWNDRRYDKGKQPGSVESTFTFDQFIDHLVNLVETKYDGDITIFGNPHVRSQVGMIYDTELDFVGKLENFNNDWSIVCEHMNVQPFEKELHQNKTKRGPYRDYYTDRTRQIVAELYSQDIERYEYQF